MSEPLSVPRAGGGTGFFNGDPHKGGRGGVTQRGDEARGRALPQWWPLAGLLALAAILRLSTLHLQSFWYDEAYVPVHTLHAGLGATLESVVHRENTPPLWYVLIWGWSRIFGTGEVALRLPSALAGIATVALAWGIGQELAGRRVAIATAALVAFNPLLVWYSQEARAYGLFVALAALAMWCWLRADAEPTRGRLAAFAASGAAALATHYFAVFLLAPMCLWLLRPRKAVRPGATPASAAPESIAATGAAARWVPPPKGAFVAVGAIVVVGAALAPLALAQGGHGTQWIGEWALASRLEAIPQYYLTGYSGAPLGHGLELLVAVEILAAVGYGLWRMLLEGGAVGRRPASRAPLSWIGGGAVGRRPASRAPLLEIQRESEAALLALGVAACGVLIPVAMAFLGADYLAPRNVVAAMIPLSAGIATIAAARRTGRTGLALVGLIALTWAVLSIDVNLSPRLQRGDWRGLAQTIGRTGRPRAITTVELGSAPLEFYLPPLRNPRRGAVVVVSEIVETGYAPLRPGAGEPPAPGFHLVGQRDINGMILYRFLAPTPRAVSAAALREHVIAEGHPEVLITATAR
jgi:mannosyltransferase